MLRVCECKAAFHLRGWLYSTIDDQLRILWKAKDVQTLAP